MLVTALAGKADEATASRVRTLDPALADGLEMLLDTESFGGRLGRYDGRVGRPFSPERGFAVTALEHLGACPLQFFFRDVLRVRELDEETDPYEAEAREVVAIVHDLLREVYASLDAAEWLGRKGAYGRAEEVLDGAWERHLVVPRARSAAAFPVLHRLESRRWRRAIGAFLRDDLARLEETGVEGAIAMKTAAYLRGGAKEVLVLGLKGEIELFGPEGKRTASALGITLDLPASLF